MNEMLDRLFRQHREAEAMLVRLQSASRQVAGEGPGTPGLLAELGWLRNEIQSEVDSHFREEERALFPVLGRHLGTSEGPILAMMEEHARFRQLQLEFEEALAALEAGLDGDWPSRIAEAAGSICRLLPPHIEKEDTVLFPMAESVLSEEEWAEAGRLWRLAQAAAAV